MTFKEFCKENQSNYDNLLFYYEDENEQNYYFVPTKEFIVYIEDNLCVIQTRKSNKGISWDAFSKRKYPDMKLDYVFKVGNKMYEIDGLKWRTDIKTSTDYFEVFEY